MKEYLSKYLIKTTLVSCLFFITAGLSLYLSNMPGTITPLWIPNTIGIIFLLNLNVKKWALPLIGMGLACYFSHILFSNDVIISSKYTLINSIEIILIAWIFKRYEIYKKFDKTITSALILIICLTLIGPALRTLLQALFISSDNLTNSFVGDGICMLSITPILLLCLKRNIQNELSFCTTYKLFAWGIFCSSFMIPTLIYLPYGFMMMLIPIMIIAIFNSVFFTLILSSLNIFIIFTLYNAGIYIPLFSPKFNTSIFVYIPTTLTLIIPYLLAIFMHILKRTQKKLKNSKNQLQEEKERFRILLASIIDCVIATDKDGKITYMNLEAERITGWLYIAAKGLPRETILKLSNLNAAPLFKNKKNIHIKTIEATLTNRTGKKYDIQYTETLLRDIKYKIIGTEIIFQDITYSKHLQEELIYNSSHDELTGLLNRREFEKKLQDAVHDFKHKGNQYTLCYLDLDFFKVVNDSTGHAAGDALLKKVASSLKHHLREDDILARLGGDEFGILLFTGSVDDNISTCNQLIHIINSIRFYWENRIYRIGASIGMVVLSNNTHTAEQLLSYADVACYAAKAEGRNQVFVYREEEAKTMEHSRKILLANTIREAFENNRLTLHAQKIIEIKPRKERPLIQYEILLRMLDEKNNLVDASTFIVIAERYNLMARIDRWVVSQMLEKYAHALSQLENSEFSINLSANSLNDPDFLAFLLSLIKKSALKPQQLCFEITETTAMNHIEETIIIVNELRKIGCKIALDDFGVGLSSFSYIKNFSVDYIKIDGSFVSNIAKSEVDKTIIKTINDMAHHLGLKTIAECVESKKVLTILTKIQVDFGQGYHIHHPESLEQLINKKL